MFKHAANQFGIDKVKLVKYTIPGAFKQQLGAVDVSVVTFDFMSYKIKNAYVIIEPGKSYYFPEAVANHINDLVDSKTLDPLDYGFDTSSDGKSVLVNDAGINNIREKE